MRHNRSNGNIKSNLLFYIVHQKKGKFRDVISIKVSLIMSRCIVNTTGTKIAGTDLTSIEFNPVKSDINYKP